MKDMNPNTAKRYGCIRHADSQACASHCNLLANNDSKWAVQIMSIVESVEDTSIFEQSGRTTPKLKVGVGIGRRHHRNYADITYLTNWVLRPSLKFYEHRCAP
jgi:hypothetical protein